MNYNLKQAIFNLKTEHDFELLAFEIYRYQYKLNPIYQQFCKLTNKTPDVVKSLTDIPFLPISFFKTQSILSSNDPVIKTFVSSGTTGNNTSKHHINDLKIYEESFNKSFDNFYPSNQNTAIIALLPSYLERENSSLIYMVNRLLERNKHPKSGFHLKLDDQTLDFLVNSDENKLLIGVTFALLDLAEQKQKLKNTTIIETGGMKGRRKEIIREELHLILKKELSAKAVHSEYGMTELLSQAYFQGDHFTCPNWMQVFKREPTDPFCVKTFGKGALNIIDLANINSCSFIATDDLGEVYNQQEFNVLGRTDNSQLRGCNLLI